MNYKKPIIATLVGSIGLSVLSLSLSIAWYSSSENLYLDTLVISVSGEQQILISTSSEISTFKDALKFRFEEDANDLKDAGLFTSVSSMFKSNWLEDDLKTEPEFYYYENSAAEKQFDYVPQYSTAEWGYYSQHLYLYSNSSLNVTVDGEDFLLNEIERYNSEYAYTLMKQQHVIQEYETKHPDWTNQQIHDDITNKLSALKKCMRVGILDVSENNFYIIDPYKDKDTLLGGRADLFLRHYYDSYVNIDDFESYEVIYGEVNGRENAVYLDARDVDSEPPETYSSFNSVTQAGVHAFDYDASVTKGLEIKKEDSLALNELEDKMTLRLLGGRPKEIIFTVYMEGWDTDCTNQHMGAGFNLDLKFKVSEKEQ